LINKVATTCFTDIKDSTPLTEAMGNVEFGRLRNNYRSFCEALAITCGATIKKGTGDGHMLVFDDLLLAFQFATQIQEYYLAQASVCEIPIELRVGMFIGAIQEEEYDAFGSGVNQAARVQGASGPGTILVNNELVEYMKTVWGAGIASSIFTDIKEYPLKGIEKPVKLATFQIQEYLKRFPERGLSSLIIKQFDGAGVVVSNLELSDVANQPLVIWPVVPRNDVTAIHSGQVEIIRLLALTGSHLHILISDCGVEDNLSKEYSEKFKERVIAHASKRGITNISYSFMTELFEPTRKDYNAYYTRFHNVISRFTLEHLNRINQKDYAEDILQSLIKKPALDFLRPALTIACILQIVNDQKKKSIIIAGADERMQWEHTRDIYPYTASKFGELYNPKLNNKDGTQSYQRGNWPIFSAWQRIVEDMEKYDFADWLAKLHLFLSVFPQQSIEVNGVEFTPDDWRDSSIEDKINKSALAKYVYENILCI